MSPFEIIFISFLVGIILLFIVCLISLFHIEWKYKKFYFTTEEGKRLYKLLNERDIIENTYTFWNNRLTALESLIDKSCYYPDDSINLDKVTNMRKEYLEVTLYLEELLMSHVLCDSKIKELVASLPKKYKHILEYNWKAIKYES